MKVTADVFEKRNVFEPIRILTMALFKLLPESIDRKIFLAFSGDNSNGSNNSDAKKVVSSATSTKAIEIIYTFRERQGKAQTRRIDNFWFDFLLNTRAIRNRMILAKQIVGTLIQEIAKKKGKVNILSLGCGSTRSVLEAMAKNRSANVFLKLIDVDRFALRMSKELAHSLDLDCNKISWKIGRAETFQDYCCDFQPDVVEVVGLLDYFPIEKAINLVSTINQFIAFNGRLVCANIIPNLESEFVRKGIGWPMIYREPEELKDIVIRGGFSGSQVRVLLEPLEVHALVVAQKEEIV